MSTLTTHDGTQIYAVLVGHSTGGGEIARCIGRHGTTRVAKVVLISATPPLILKTAANPRRHPTLMSTRPFVGDAAIRS